MGRKRGGAEGRGRLSVGGGAVGERWGGSCGREVGSPRCSPVVASLPETSAAALTPSAKGVGGLGVGEGPQRWSGKESLEG